MLGVRRASVADAAARLESDRVIEYSRGTIHVLDGAALEAASCECYQFIRDEYALVIEETASTASTRKRKTATMHAVNARTRPGSPARTG